MQAHLLPSFHIIQAAGWYFRSHYVAACAEIIMSAISEYSAPCKRRSIITSLLTYFTYRSIIYAVNATRAKRRISALLRADRLTFANNAFRQNSISGKPDAISSAEYLIQLELIFLIAQIPHGFTREKKHFPREQRFPRGISSALILLKSDKRTSGLHTWSSHSIRI